MFRFHLRATVAPVFAIMAGYLQAAAPQQAGVVIGKYCATCHSAQLHTASLVLDPAAVTHVTTDAERWEKVIRKLRSGTMPPPGAPRPDQATSDAVANFLETELD